MNITLVNPRLATWSPNVYPPLGLAYIAASLGDNLYFPKIVDMNSQRISDEKLAEQIKKADVVGITGLITEYNEVIRLVGVVKRAKPDAIVILGGALATTHPRELLLNSAADYVVIGEGEKIVVELLNAIRFGDDILNIKGIAYRRAGKLFINPLASPIEDLDTLKHPARDLLDMSRYTTHHFKSYGMRVGRIKSATMISSRGCPYSCSFCFKDVCGTRWRGRSASDIFSEMCELNTLYGINGFVFNDDTFVVNKKRVMEFCQILKDSGFGFKWYCNGRVNLMDEEMIKVMSESGCVGIAYGIESGNQDILNSINKSITLEQVERITALTKKYGIHVTGYFMLGILGDSKETIRQTFDFARKLDLDFYGFSMTSPIIGTPMYEQALGQGFKVEKELKDFSFYISINMTKDCTDAELLQFNKDAFREFTIEKRYGKHYLFNPVLWWDGLRSLVFLIGKRNYNELIKKAWGLIKK